MLAGRLVDLGERRFPVQAAHERSGTGPGGGHSLTIPRPSFTHLASLTDSVGLYEHALFRAPRPEHGYCTDDVARALTVVVREPDSGGRLTPLAEVYLGFLEAAQLPDGRFHNRRAAGRHGTFTDTVGSDDSNGRALHGLGVAAAQGHGEIAARALACFESGTKIFSSPSPRANAYAVLGAAEVAARHPGHAGAAALFARAGRHLGKPPARRAWPWPEPRLAYDNARLAEVRISAGLAFGRPALVSDGLMLLRWLVGIELRGRHFSFTPVDGWELGQPRPGFDQQPTEASAMADACAAAVRATHDGWFAETGLLAVRWFFGLNDIGVELADPVSGGCRDGLERFGFNENQGAESTLSLIAALQAARVLQPAARRARSSSSVETYAAPTQRSAAPYVM